MEIGWKLLLLWTASMALFISAGIATWLTLDVMEGVSGLTIRFFLGYCGIIVVSQVFCRAQNRTAAHLRFDGKEPAVDQADAALNLTNINQGDRYDQANNP